VAPHGCNHTAPPDRAGSTLTRAHRFPSTRRETRRRIFANNAIAPSAIASSTAIQAALSPTFLQNDLVAMVIGLPKVSSEVIGLGGTASKRKRPRGAPPASPSAPLGTSTSQEPHAADVSPSDWARNSLRVGHDQTMSWRPPARRHLALNNFRPAARTRLRLAFWVSFTQACSLRRIVPLVAHLATGFRRKTASG